ncbi:hypothetical protein MMC30_003162 [Trapelia coarctata]|nr:hypothetical protein [Trapelia coarctata]
MTKLLESRAAHCGRKRRLDSLQDKQTSDAEDKENGSLSDSTEASMQDLGQPNIILTSGSEAKKARTTGDAKEQKTPEQSSVAIHTIATTSTTTSDETRVRAVKTSFDSRLRGDKPISPSHEWGRAEAFGPSLRNGVTHKPSLHENESDVSRPGGPGTLSAHEYQCQWLACSRTFPDLSRLREHVLSKHMVGTRRNGVSSFDCMWPDCRSLEDIGFSSKDAWEEHMDSQHYSLGVSGPGPFFDGPAQPSIEPTRPSTSSAPQSANLEQHVSPQPGGTHNQPIELSDGSNSDEGSTTESESVYGEGDSQLSVSDSAFASQYASNLPRQPPQGRIFNRKEAYKAAIGKGDRDWATYSPFPSSNTEAEQELELQWRLE